MLLQVALFHFLLINNIIQLVMVKYLKEPKFTVFFGPNSREKEKKL